MVTLPVFHGASGAEVIADMLDAFVPVEEILIAEAASRRDALGFRLPLVDRRDSVDLVHMSKMLHEMVLPPE